MRKIIAEHGIFLLSPEGIKSPIRIHIRAPYELDKDGTWACACHIDGIFEKEMRAFGQGSLQALCLSLQLLRIQLAHVERLGGQFFYDEALTVPIFAADILGDHVTRIGNGESTS